MRRSYSLAPLNGVGPALVFEWDPVTGDVTGRDAGEVLGMADDAKRAGFWMGHPHPTAYPVFDPLRRPAELAVVLGNVYRLSEDLAAAYPKPAIEELPPGAIA